MTITINNNQEFKNCLAILGKVVSKKCAMPIWQCVRIDCEGGIVYLTTRNSDQSISIQPSMAFCDSEGHFAIDYQQLKDAYAKGKKGESSTIVWDADKYSATIKAGAISRTYTTFDASEYELLHNQGEPCRNSFLCNPEIPISQIAKNCANDTQRPVLNCVVLDTDADAAVASNGNVMAISRLNAVNVSRTNTKECLIPLKIAELMDFSGSMNVYMYDLVTDTVRIDTCNMPAKYGHSSVFSFVSRNPGGRFPKYMNVVHRYTESDLLHFENPNEVISVLKELSSVAELNHAVTINGYSCSENVALIAKDVDLAKESECTVKLAQSSAYDVKIRLDCEMLCKTIPSGWNGKMWIDDESCATVMEIGGGSIYLIMPLLCEDDRVVKRNHTGNPVDFMLEYRNRKEIAVNNRAQEESATAEPTTTENPAPAPEPIPTSEPAAPVQEVQEKPKAEKPKTEKPKAERKPIKQTERKDDLPYSDMQLEVVANILQKAIEDGDANGWEKPWADSMFVSGGMVPHNMITGRAYGDVNSFILSLLCAQEGWKTPAFVTLAKIKELGLSINRTTNEEGEDVCVPPAPVMEYWRTRYDKTTENEDGEQVPVLDDEGNPVSYVKRHKRMTTVWNLDQTNFAEKYPDRYKELCEAAAKRFSNKHDEDCKDDAFDLMLSQPQDYWLVGEVRHGGNQAYFSDGADLIQLPERRSFVSASAYYGTAAHEMTHSTSRVKHRPYMESYHSSKSSRAMEELVAELGAAIICHDLGMEKEINDEHKNYAANWAQCLKGEHRKEIARKLVTDIMDAVGIFFSHYRKAEKDLGIEHEQKKNEMTSKLSSYKLEDEGDKPIMVRRYTEKSLLVIGGSKADRVALCDAINKAFPADTQKNSKKKILSASIKPFAPHGMVVWVRNTKVSEDALREQMTALNLSISDWNTTDAMKPAVGEAAPVQEVQEVQEVREVKDGAANHLNFIAYSEKGVIMECADPPENAVLMGVMRGLGEQLGVSLRYWPNGLNGTPAGWQMSKKASQKVKEYINRMAA